MSLYDALSKISTQVEKQRPLIASEDDTILVSIHPFVRALGYDTQNLAEFRAQFSADAKSTGGEKVDYAILRDGEPIVFIEAKAAYISLNETHWKQLYHYFNAQDVRFGILTNGIEFRFYTDLNKRHIMDKEPMLVLDMLNLDERTVSELGSFTKESFDPQRILDGAQKRRIADLLARELEQPSNNFVRHFAKQVHSGRLTETDAQKYKQLLREAWQTIVKGIEDGSNGKTDCPKPPPPPPKKGDIPVFGYHEGHKFKAGLLRKSVNNGLTVRGNQIRYNGETTWLKNAAVMAIRSVEPSFEPTKTYPNGFKFWHVVDPADGKEHMIGRISGWDNITDESLRQRVLSS